MKRSEQEVNNLKDHWARDPIWDIESTEGFEEHREELLQYRLSMEQKWRDKRDKEVLQKMDKMGILPMNTDRLFWYLSGLECRIETLERENEKYKES